MKSLISFLILFYCFPAISKSLLQEKYPQGLLTDDYGVLNKTDLVYETQRGVTPYKLEDDLSAYQRWQCFETKKIKFLYDVRRDDYSDFGHGAILCDYSFEVNDDAGVHHFYIARRAKEITDCRALFREWKKIRKNSQYACILGEAGSYKNKEKAWTWGKTKTKNGCMSYFVGECDSEKRLKEH